MRNARRIADPVGIAVVCAFFSMPLQSFTDARGDYE
jgi:hypothetical protein